MNKKYILVDFYDGEEELLGEFDDVHEAKVAMLDRDLDTDGECDLVVKVWSENLDRYVRMPLTKNHDKM